jgi:hypothetical protein
MIAVITTVATKLARKKRTFSVTSEYADRESPRLIISAIVAGPVVSGNVKG